MSEKSKSVVIKACGGNRSKNLDGIANALDNIMNNAQKIVTGYIYLSPEDVRKITGYAEQLRIIADEIK